MLPARSFRRDGGRVLPGRARCRDVPRACRLAFLAATTCLASPATAQDGAFDSACRAEALPRSVACRGPTLWVLAAPEARIEREALIAFPAATRDGRVPGATTFFDAVHPSSHADSSRRSDAWTFLGAVAGVAIVGIPAALIGHDIDRGLHEDEVSEDPGLVGAVAGFYLGGGIGGVVGAHLGSGRRGSPWLPLGIVGAAIPLMLLDLELAAVAPAVGVVLAVAIEINAGQAPADERAAPR